MVEDEDLDAAVTQGVLTQAQVDALRTFVSSRRLSAERADDEAVEFRDDFAGREVGHAGNVSMVTLRLVYTQISAAMSRARRTIASASSGPSTSARAAASA